ncbi:MAG: M50 family metallopeptidase, partial [Acidobacteria bacterium]|nr:M50 family metallopeptidase [Acidobacteriota bacterium]
LCHGSPSRWFIPMASLLVYPLRLFVTFIHEGGHALAALFTLGSVRHMIVYPNASGETLTQGGIPLIIASAGYLTSTAYGASLLVLCRNGLNSKPVLFLTAGLILILTAGFSVNTFTLITGIALSAGIILVAIWSSKRVAHFFLSFLAVQCCLNAVLDLNTLFLISATTNSHSDARAMQGMTFIPSTIWAVFWLAISVITLLFALRTHYYSKGFSS